MRSLGPILMRMSTHSLRDNLEDPDFVDAVDGLVKSLYENITQIAVFQSLDDLFLLLVVREVYVEREHDDPDTIAYVARSLARLSRMEAVPEEVQEVTGNKNVMQNVYPLSLEAALADAPEKRTAVYQFVGDRSLFLSGVFPDTNPKRIRAEQQFGRQCYHNIAKRDDISTYSKEVFSELSRIFGFYVNSLNTIAREFLNEPNKKIVTDMMLDAINKSKKTNNPKAEEEASRYAQILNISQQQ